MVCSHGMGSLLAVCCFLLRLAYTPLPLRLDGNTAAAVTGHGFVLGAKYALCSHHTSR
jgi:hypothetical protein